MFKSYHQSSLLFLVLLLIVTLWSSSLLFATGFIPISKCRPFLSRYEYLRQSTSGSSPNTDDTPPVPPVSEIVEENKLVDDKMKNPLEKLDFVVEEKMRVDDKMKNPLKNLNFDDALGKIPNPVSGSTVSEEGGVGHFLNSFKEKLLNIPSSFDTDTVKSNILDGEVGGRGEVYVGVQAALFLCVLLGGIPFMEQTLVHNFMGPLLLVSGPVIIGLAIKDLGLENLSPWPVPPTELKSLSTDGVFSKIRHPMYTGLLTFCVGLSLVTGSVDRLLFSIILFYGLEIKSDYEEKELEKKFPDAYHVYQDKVPGKFFPTEFLEKLPWN